MVQLCYFKVPITIVALGFEALELKKAGLVRIIGQYHDGVVWILVVCEVMVQN